MARLELTELCQDATDQVNEKMSFLFDEYDFELIYQEDAKLGERCLFVLESPACRLRVTSEFGRVGLDIGTLDAPTGWQDAPDGKWEWFGIDSVIEFVGGRRPTLDELRQDGERVWAMTPAERLEELATRLRPIAVDVFALFRRDAAPERRQAFEAFLSG